MSESTLIDDDDPEFFDALEDFTFSDPSDSQNSTSVHKLNNNNNNHNSVSNPPEPPSVPFSAGLRRRRQSSKEFRFKNSSDVLADAKLHASPEKGYKFLLNLKDKPLKKDTDMKSLLVKETDMYSLLKKDIDMNSLNSSSALTEGEIVNDDRSATVDSVNSVNSNLVFTLIWLIMKVISMKASLLVKVVTFLVWLTHASCMFVTNPFAVIARAKRHAIRSVLRLLRSCLGEVKRIVYKLITGNKSVGKLCMQIGWGLLCAAFVGFVLFCLLVFAFVVGGVVMKCVVEAPVSKIARLSFDYTRDAPMAFVPIMSCFGRDCGCDEKIEFDNVGMSRVVPLDRKLQATVSLTLPESGYNRNLGNFQVRVDYLSSNGKPLSSATQPCTMRFKSWPIRLLMTVFNLVPLITGYSSESQTVDIKFNGYTEQEIPTSCVRVVLEPRAEFAKGGGVPEIYTARLKLESQLPLLKRLLWSWKATVFVWTSIAIFKLVLVFVLLCCAPWLRLSGGPPLNNTGSS
ncbi:putative Seipin family protein [Helianthus annuus]|nr:putative Seipin family protein [Helianthus annuus]